jgi:hypothetical protein
MRNSMVSALLFGLAASFIGCAAEEANPTEGSISSAVSEEGPNYVLACGGLALRTYDAPNATPKDTLGYGVIVYVGQVDWTTRMANIRHVDPYPFSGWMRIDGANGPLLSANLTECH